MFAVHILQSPFYCFIGTTTFSSTSPKSYFIVGTLGSSVRKKIRHVLKKTISANKNSTKQPKLIVQ